MKIKLCLFLILSTSIAFGQSSDLNLLQQRLEAFRVALLDPTLEQMNTLVCDQLTYGHSSGKVENKSEFIENLLNGNSNFDTISIVDQQIQIHHKTAIVRHQFTAKTSDRGKPPGAVALFVMTVWTKSGKTWKLLARQAVKRTS
jgi:hypothetical protein